MKEELLEKLSEMKQALNSSTKEEIEKELQQIENNRNNINFDITELELKLSDDSNYPSFTYMRNQTRIYDCKEKLANLEQEKLENNAKISLANARVNYLEGEISACNELLSEDQNALEELGRQLRSLGETPDEELANKITEEINYHRSNITYLMNELNYYEEERKENVNNLNSYNSKAPQLEDEITKFNDLLVDLNNQEEIDSKNLIDNDKKQQDEEKLKQLKQQIDVLNSRYDYLSYDVSSELVELMYNVENDELDNNQIIEKLNEIKNKIPSNYMEKDYNAIAENNSLRTELSNQKAALELKLSDEVNYTPSVFEVEVMHEEISSLENSIFNQEANISSVSAEIGRFERIKQSIDFDIKNSENRITELEHQKESLKLRNILSAKTEEETKLISKELKEITKEIENIQSKIARLQKANLEIDLSNVMRKNVKKNLELIKNKDVKELESKRESLNDRKTVNKLAMQEDKKRLQIVTDQITALEHEGRLLNYEFEAGFYEIQEKLNDNKANLNSNESQLEPIKAADIMKDMYNENDLYQDGQFKDMIANNSIDMDKKETPYINVVEPVNHVKSDNHEEIEYAFEMPEGEFESEIDDDLDYENDDIISDELGETQEEKSDLPVPAGPIITHEIENEEENKPVIITGFKKLKDKVIEKLKDKEFVKKATAFFLTATTVATMAFGLGRLKGKDEVESPSIEIVDTISNESENKKEDENGIVNPQNKKSNYEIALEVIRGEWGHNPERRERLLNAGYDYYAIQSIVNDLMKDYTKEDHEIEEEKEVVIEPTVDEPTIEENIPETPTVPAPVYPTNPEPFYPNYPTNPEPIYPTNPEPDIPASTIDEIELLPGQTLIIDNGNSSTIVDNSNGANDNSGLIPENSNNNYFDAGIKVEENDNGSLDVTIPSSNIDATSSSTMTEEKLSDYYKLLEELGIGVQAPEEESKSYGK